MEESDYIPDAEYRAAPGLSYSELCHLMRSPAHLQEYRRNPPERTKAMALGAALHIKLLEPDRFTEEYVCFDDTEFVESLRQRGNKNPRATNDYKDFKQQFELVTEGKEILTAEEYQQISNMAASALEHPAAGGLLRLPGNVEMSLYWKDAESGVDMKARLDKYISSGRIVDIKTTDNASADFFQRSIWNYNYYLQAAVYSTGVKEALKTEPGSYTLIAIEKNPPYAVAVYELDEVSMELGLLRMRSLIDLYAECLRADDWPGYSNRIESISLPSYAAAAM